LIDGIDEKGEYKDVSNRNGFLFGTGLFEHVVRMVSDDAGQALRPVIQTGFLKYEVLLKIFVVL
jgi:hypothetical protein